MLPRPKEEILLFTTWELVWGRKFELTSLKKGKKEPDFLINRYLE